MIEDWKPGLPLDSVFHPTDFSRASEHAFVHALRVALAARSEITLFHVNGPNEPPHWRSFPSVRGTLERWGVLPADSPPDDVRNLGISVEKITTHGGKPVAAIRGYLAEHPAGLIVLASTSRQGLTRWRQRSVAGRLARGSRTNTLFVPSEAAGFVSPEDGRVRLKRVLIPFDRAPLPQAAVSVAAAYSRALGATAATFHPVYLGEAGALPALKQPEGGSWKWREPLRRGRAGDELRAAIAEIDPQLIVVATRGRSGVLGAMRGNITEQVLRHARCPVLAVAED